MVDDPPIRLAYNLNLFVGRTDLIEPVMDKARRLAAGAPVERRVILVRGQRGVGKTWLLRRLEDRVRAEVAMATHRVELDKHAAPDALNAALPVERPLLLLIDDVNEVDDDGLDALEEQWLGPLASAGQALIVLAERGRPHAWTAPEFRLKAEEYDLGGLGEEEASEQVRLQVPEAIDRAAEIFDLARGYPWSTYILARPFPDKATALRTCADSLLHGLDGGLRPYLQALSILNAFDESRMAAVLPKYSDDFAARTWDYAACRDVRKQLLDSTLARWDEKSRGYVLDAPIRLVLDALLHETDREAWVRLHCVAFLLYTEWCGQFPQSAPWWAAERRRHESRLSVVGYSPDDCQEGGTREEKDGA